MVSPELKELPHHEKGVIFALVRDEKILLSLRIKPASAYWGSFIIPGGRFERGEEAQDALKREMLEECGVTPGSFCFLFQKDMVTESGNRIFQHVFLVSDFDGEVVNKEPDKEQHKWVDLYKAEELLDFEFSREVLRQVISSLNAAKQSKG